MMQKKQAYLNSNLQDQAGNIELAELGDYATGMAGDDKHADQLNNQLGL